MNHVRVLFKRLVRPAELGLVMAMGVLGYAGFSDTGILDGSEWSDAIGFFGVSVGVLLLYGMITENRDARKVALLAAFFIWLWRFFAVLFIAKSYSEGLWLSLAWAIVAGTLYWEEHQPLMGRRSTDAKGG
jgi:hypothetical protein